MKRILLAALLLIPVEARALNIDNLLSVIAMPLAVAAVSEVSGVPTSDLSHFVASLNNANVPPTQFVDLLRYVPVALVQDSTQQQPVFVDYVQQQVSQGVSGIALVPLIIERLRTYDIQPPPPQPQIIYVDRTYIPTVVQTRVDEIRKQPKKVRVIQQQPVVVVQQQPSKKVRVIVAPPMISAAPPQAMPPGQAKKQRADEKGVPPGQAKKMEEGGKEKKHGHD